MKKYKNEEKDYRERERERERERKKDGKREIIQVSLYYCHVSIRLFLTTFECFLQIFLFHSVNHVSLINNNK